MFYKEYTVRVQENGDRSWWINGKLHREDGPAYEGAYGDRSWWINGKPHREDGPAVEQADGTRQWWIDGERLTEEEFKNRNKTCDGKIVEIDGIKYQLKIV